MARSQCARSSPSAARTSTAAAVATPGPAAVNCSATAAAASPSTSARTTRSPRRTSAAPNARPMPDAPPVTIATRDMTTPSSRPPPDRRPGRSLLRARDEDHDLLSPSSSAPAPAGPTAAWRAGVSPDATRRDPPGHDGGPAPRGDRASGELRSGGAHRVGLGTLLALDDLEADPLALVEALVAVHLDGRVVNEDVLAAVDGDEAQALLGVEPLHGALCHVCSHVRAVTPPLVMGRGLALPPAEHERGTRT